MRFRVMTRNIHRAIGIDRRFRPDRVTRVIESWAPDVVQLQEVDDGVPRSRRVNLARELAGSAGYPHMAVGHNVTLRRGRPGDATLSRAPIFRERNIAVTIGAPKRRGCTHTCSSLVGYAVRTFRLEVLNLHLGLSARQRDPQMVLLAHSRELASLPADAACVVGGDFSDGRSRLHPFFTGPLQFRFADERTPKEEKAFLTFPCFFPRGPLDRVYYRGPLGLLAARRGRLGLSRIASDHLSVVADFAIR